MPQKKTPPTASAKILLPARLGSDIRLLVAASELVERLARRIGRQARENGLPDLHPGHLVVLAAVDPNGISRSDLEQRLGLGRNITYPLRRLEEDGLVLSVEDPSDARARRVVPTPLGRSLLETVAAAVDAPETASLIERIKRHSDVLAQPIKRS
jgi:DNA-binding MarR family transcriptional regulator